MSVESAEAATFERRYQVDPDPWGYDSRPYERAKYQRTLAALPPTRPGFGLEMGCSNGAFTSMLAERCDRLLAVDFSKEAVRLATERTAGAAGVSVELADLRSGLPPGPFDLIVCSEILYYWQRSEVLGFCGRVLGSLTPRGSLIAVHWRGRGPDTPMTGDSVHALLASELDGALDHARSEAHEDYLLDRWEGRPRR